MKKLFVIALAVLFVLGLSGLALANNTATVNQTSPDNEAIVTQDGSGNDIDLVQDNLDVNSWNYANISQKGDGDVVNIYQKRISYPGWGNANLAEVKQLGSDNWLVGADYCGVINPSKAATQTTEFGHNALWVTQDGDENKIGLYQKGLADNSANITQAGGGNTLVAYQKVPSGKSNILGVGQSGSNEATICQLNYAEDDRNWAYLTQDGYGNVVDIYQERHLPGWAATGNNAVNVSQHGNDNKLVGANIDGTINFNSPATQKTSYGFQRIDAHQYGNENTIGLYQEGPADNEAVGPNQDVLIQDNDGNSLGVYQKTLGGSNMLYAYQDGDDVATVSQTAMSGNNIATIIQN